MTNKQILELLKDEARKAKARSKWLKGIKAYCFDLLDYLEEDENFKIDTYNDFSKALFCGATNWKQLASCGEHPTLVSNYAIRERLLTDTEKKKSNIDEIDLQARALEQAANVLKSIYKTIIK